MSLVSRPLALAIVSAVLLALSGTGSQAKDIIITNPVSPKNDKRFDYPKKILQLALERSQDRFGEFEIKRYASPISRSRALLELAAGRITVYVAPTQPQWEAEAIPVRIPLRKGILGYKIFLIRKEDQAKFDTVRTLSDLDDQILGAGSQWSSTQAFHKLGIKTEGGTQYEALFEMLMSKRFDYFPRGINEVFSEYEQRKSIYPGLAIEDKLAFYVPNPTYFFVSPKKPELVERLTYGLDSILEDGTLDGIFNKTHAASIRKANLRGRTIINLQNLTLPPETPFDQLELWYHRDGTL